MKMKLGFILSGIILLSACQKTNILNTGSPNHQTTLIDESQSDATKKEIKKNTFEEIYGFYKLSNNFMKKLNDFSDDKVLNNNEINNLLSNSSDTEQDFIKIIKNKESFYMTNLKRDESDNDELDFVINKDFSITGDFIKKLGSYISDNLLDKNEIDDLAINASSEEKAFLLKISSYDSYNNFPFIDINNKVKEANIKIYYDEKQLIKGNSILEILSNIGQNDRIINTYNDETRCGSGVIINSVLLTKGKEGFYDLSEKLGLKFNSLTYENVHLIQEKLMDKVSESKGLNILKNIENNQIIGGTMIDSFKVAGLKWDTNAVKKINGSFQDDINNYFKENNNGAIILTGYLDKNLKKIVFNKTVDHSVLLSYKNNKFIITDTSGRNGSGLNNLELNESDLKEIYTSNHTFIKILV